MNLKDKTVVIDNKTYRYSKIVMLPTNEDISSIFDIPIIKWHDNNVIQSTLKQFNNNGLWLGQHLYFLSSDKICEGDWCIIDLAENTRVIKVKSLNSGHPIFTVDIEDGYAQLTNLKKIIATTDKSLTFDDGMNSWFLPKPSPEFIQKYIDAYNKGEKIEQCLVEYEKYWANSKGAKGNTFTEVALFEESINDYDAILVYYPKITKGEITIRKVKDSWSRNEVVELCKKAFDAGMAYSTGSYTEFKQIHPNREKWISENL